MITDEHPIITVLGPTATGKTHIAVRLAAELGGEIVSADSRQIYRRMDKDGYLVYEKYRGLTLTPKGVKLGKRLVQRHELLEQFLRIIGVEEEHVYDDVEGIEHHLSWNSIDRIADLVQLMESDPGFVNKLEQLKTQQNS